MTATASRATDPTVGWCEGIPIYRPFTVPDNGMSPRFRKGDVVNWHPRRPAQPGEVAVVKVKRRGAWVYLLRRVLEDSASGCILVVCDVNGHTEVIPRDQFGGAGGLLSQGKLVA